MSHLEVDSNPDTPEPPTPEPEEVAVVYSKKDEKFLVWRKNCKCCNHPRRADLEKRIMAGDTLNGMCTEDNKELNIEAFPDLNPPNISAHRRNHMPRPMQEALKEQYDKHAVEQLDAASMAKEMIIILQERMKFLTNSDYFRLQKDKIQALEIARRIAATIMGINNDVKKLETKPQTAKTIKDLMKEIAARVKAAEEEAEKVAPEAKTEDQSESSE